MIQIAIAGYGNLGRGVEAAVMQAPDMNLFGIFTRRNPDSLREEVHAPVFSYDTLWEHKAEIDVVILCGGSATDLPMMTPAIAENFCVVDSFDTHANIPAHFDRVDRAAVEGDTLAMISGGWDPGYFSLARLYMEAALPEGREYTFWGRGVSQGHSDAIRRIPGVADARQYTVPSLEAVERVREGDAPDLTATDMHQRVCYVVAEEGADQDAIHREIVTMPNYFAEYETTVHFITAEEMEQEHSGLPHGGRVLRSGNTGWTAGFQNTMEFSLALDSNPFFTASILTACARAVARLYQKGERGCCTILDIPPAMLSSQEPAFLRQHLL